MIRVAICGASGYAGIELIRILARHPEVELVALTSSRWEGRSARDAVGVGGAVGRLRFRSSVEATPDAVFLATPAEFSLEEAPRWVERGALAIDLSDAFRHDDRAVYGLTEIARERLRGARFIANPGCYPTASQLPLIPLVEAGLLGEGPLILDAKSGSSGAGRRLDDSLLFSELMDNHYPYRVGTHRHVPEIERGLGRAVVFTPHLLPTRRGLLVSAYAPLATGASAAACHALLAERYRDEPFVQLFESGEREIGIASVVGTPLCRISVSPIEKLGIVQIFSVIDNLLKGAASQAVQNFNAALGIEETTGLS
ncbi:MAG: N-acetyl-gamma-glutamyl-phosphate reductase [Myxococcales bacterium]|nr:N-acetyl-gamma-glutamyl-phosphate reductase [Myxococcales bacterium]